MSLSHPRAKKQYDSKNSARQVDIVPGAVRVAPLHLGKQAKDFRDMREHHHYKAPGTEKTQQRSGRPSSRDLNNGNGEEHSDQDQPEECLHYRHQLAKASHHDRGHGTAEF